MCQARNLAAATAEQVYALADVIVVDIPLDVKERRVARPDAEQSRILKALQLEIPERLSPDRLL